MTAVNLWAVQVPTSKGHSEFQPFPYSREKGTQVAPTPLSSGRSLQSWPLTEAKELDFDLPASGSRPPPTDRNILPKHQPPSPAIAQQIRLPKKCKKRRSQLSLVWAASTGVKMLWSEAASRAPQVASPTMRRDEGR